MNIKKGDTVKIISGNDKGKQGKVLAVIPLKNRIVVEGMNMKKKHVRPRKQNQKGEMVHIPGAFDASRVMMVCPKCSKPMRVKYIFDGALRKTRICRTCESVL